MKWYEIRAKKEAPETTEIWLYDQIGKDWFGEGMSAKEFIAELNAVKTPQIDLHINSPGGEVFDGAAIYNALKRHPATVSTFIDGIAASIASVIALAGKTVTMAANALYMLHNPSGLVMGTSGDMRKTADILDKVRDTMVSAYATKSGKSDEDIIAILDAETWLDAEEAKAAGFVDVIGDEIAAAASAVQFLPIMAKYGYKHIPRVLQASKEVPDQRTIERALRDAGCSSSAAKGILARGYADALREGAPSGVSAVVEEQPREAASPTPARIDNAARLLREADLIIGGTTK